MIMLNIEMRSKERTAIRARGSARIREQLIHGEPFGTPRAPCVRRSAGGRAWRRRQQQHADTNLRTAHSHTRSPSQKQHSHLISLRGFVCFIQVRIKDTTIFCPVGRLRAVAARGPPPAEGESEREGREGARTPAAPLAPT